MANINLSTSGMPKTARSSNFGLVVMAIILFLVLAIWGSLILYGNSLSSQISDTKLDYTASQENLLGGKALQLADFQDRLDLTEKLSANGKDMSGVLRALEKSMVRGVYVASLKYSADNSTIVFEFVANNYNEVAKQIAALKLSESFTNVIAKESSTDLKSNSTKFSVSLSLK